MQLPALLLFILFLLLSVFFSSSETAFVAAYPYRIKRLEKKRSKRATLVRGNILVNTAAALGDELEHGDHRFVAKRMKKQQIEILRILSRPVEE